MSVQEMFAEIPKLSYEEQLALYEKLSQSLGKAAKQSSRRIVPANMLRGILKTIEPPPTDEEIKNDYISYLEEKYS